MFILRTKQKELIQDHLEPLYDHLISGSFGLLKREIID